ncbi:MAG TPA: hypothetical protein VM031_01070 [Phycisphaerae bacterium]|nr:hypothetical protein [Phycisphaerae bacterium]
MKGRPPHPDIDVAETTWQKNARLIREGFRDLEYLPAGPSAWNMTLAALAFSARRQIAGQADLNLWAAMHGCAPSARYEQLGRDALVLWHGTSAQRAEKIRTHGLMHKRGVWAASEPKIAHGFTRGRSRAFQAGSAMVVLVINRNEWDGRAEREAPDIARFHESIPAEHIEYILWSDRIEALGERKPPAPKCWGVARFKKHAGRWVPRSRPPVRLDAERTYTDRDEWLDESIRRIAAALTNPTAIEVFSSLYATIDPWEALEHRQILEAIRRLAGSGRQVRGGLHVFPVTEATA